MYKLVIRPVLFGINPERVHNLLVSFLKIPMISKILGLIYTRKNPGLQCELFGINFPNPVGLAAGFDKNAELVNQLSDIGFGFVEIGTVTPHPQPGNAKPRIFRLKKDQALINRMGFNNDGMHQIKERLSSRKQGVIIGGNIGKNKSTPNEKAGEDYTSCFDCLYDVVDYFVVNVSSPNTPGLRNLQEKEPLTQILQDIQKRNRNKEFRKPVLLKIAPDLNENELDDIIEIVISTRIDGVIATNTTISRENLRTNPDTVQAFGAGGLSGKPLAGRSTKVIQYLAKKSGGKFPIIGVGGIHSAEDAIEKIKAGASLVQIYTGFIYEGPALIRQINKKMLAEGLYSE